MKQNRKTITEGQLRNIVAESVKNVLNEFQAGENDWGQNYSEYKQQNQTNEELGSVVMCLRIICQCTDDICKAVNYGQPSRLFPNCPLRDLRQAYGQIAPIWNLMATEDNRLGDAQAMTADQIKQECGQSLKQLSQMQGIDRISIPAWMVCRALGI